MGPQETKDERRAIYFGPLFPRRSAVARDVELARRRKREREPEAEEWRGGGRGTTTSYRPTRDDCREPHAIKAKRYETRDSPTTRRPCIAVRKE